MCICIKCGKQFPVHEIGLSDLCPDCFFKKGANYKIISPYDYKEQIKAIEEENNNKIPEEKLKEWREEMINISIEEWRAIGCVNTHELTERQLIARLDPLDAYLAACEKRQEEIDIESSIIKEYREQCILNAEELTTLRANHEEFARKMGDEIHARNNHVRELKKEIHRLKDLVKRAKPYVVFGLKSAAHQSTEIECEQWLKQSSEVIGE